MSCSLEKIVFQFFEEKIDLEKPILLALSGGADSLSLFYLLCEYSKLYPIKWHVVHVDHGWRKESKEELKTLETLAHLHGREFYSCSLDPSRMKGNLEALSRKARLLFFQEVAEKTGAQGVILGHHLDDQAETVFMRIFEGAKLSCCSGMQPVSPFGTLTLFRPLLSVTKEEIVQWLQQKKVAYFEDSTNFDPQFMRARLRVEIFPFLRRSFGKEFRSSLLSIGQDAFEMRDYFNKKYAKVLHEACFSDCGAFFDLSKCLPEHPFELKELLRVIGEHCDFYLNRYQMNLVIALLCENQANKYVELQAKTLYIDRKRLFVFERIPLFEGQDSTTGNWRVETHMCQAEEVTVIKNSWKDVFKGDCSTLLPCNSAYSLRALDLRQRRKPQGKVVANFLSERKVPHLLARFCPAVYVDDDVIEDFLLGEKILTKGPVIYMTLKREQKLSLKDFCSVL